MHSKSFATITATILCFCTVSAQINSSNPNIPADLWESKDGVVNVAVTLTGIEDNGRPLDLIKIFVKNTSASVQALIVSSDSDQGRGFYIFTIDSNGIKHLLHERTLVHKKGASPQELLQERLQEIKAHSGSVWSQDISPGETISGSIVISPADLALVKSRPVQCNFSIINPKTSQEFHIDSTPKMLTEIGSK